MDRKQTGAWAPWRAIPWTAKPFSPSKEIAAQEIRSTPEITRIWSDGSLLPTIGVGAAATYLAGDDCLQALHHLGSDKAHTVFEAELIGIRLAMTLLRSQDLLYASDVEICVDNQSAVRSILKPADPSPGQSLVLSIHDEYNDLLTWRRINGHGNQKVTFRWVPGHLNIPGNEVADILAKYAARELACEDLGPQPRSSISALKANLKKEIKRKQSQRTQATGTGAIARRTARQGVTPVQAFNTIKHLPKDNASLLVQLRTGHCSLLAYLN